METFRIVKSQYDEFSVERLNKHNPEKWVPCGDLRNPILRIAGDAGYDLLESQRKIYNSYSEANDAIVEHNKGQRVWVPVYHAAKHGVVVGPWEKVEGYCWMRCIKGSDGSLPYRVAFIEKSPRVRIRDCSGDIFSDPSNWFYLTGEEEDDKILCDNFLISIGYILEN